MEPKTPFTKKDLVVILGCVVFLLANLGAISGGGARRRAKEMVCLSNLHQWGIIFQMYLDDNEGKFSGGEETVDGFVEHIWVLYLLPYFETFDIMLCPTTTKTWCDGVTGTFVAWDFRCREEFEPPEEWYWYYGDSYGSCGKNSWCSQWEHGADPTDGGWNWKTIDSVTGGHRVPLLLGCSFLGGFPLETDEPPPYEGEFNMGGREMGRYCMNRHNGCVNGLFLDWSARKIGLKELWTLKWHRGFDINGPWTIAGFAGNEAACAAAWDEAAPWMRDFPEY